MEVHMFLSQLAARLLPSKIRQGLDTWVEAIEVVGEIRDPRVLASLVPSALRGLILRRGKQGRPTAMPARHEAWFDWTYAADQPEMADLYRRAKAGQWDGDSLPWHLSVDPEDPEAGIFPIDFLDWRLGEEVGIRLDEPARMRLLNDFGAWALTQFLHGEQGALYASAQVTEAVRFMDGKFYGASQVMDEARHVEVFSRYLDEKIGRLYQVNDNLFTIIDALMTDGRWDMKFLGMQIMIEGLALGAFGTLHARTREPLLKELLAQVIRDEARHVHFGVVALRRFIKDELDERERREREDWAFEVAMLMRNRFLAREVWEEHYAGTRVTWADWKRFILGAPGMEDFRMKMFSRMVPNLREIGLLSPRIQTHYDKVGLMRYFRGVAADRLTSEELLDDTFTEHEAVA
jgi:hypothetical protein